MTAPVSDLQRLFVPGVERDRPVRRVLWAVVALLGLVGCRDRGGGPLAAPGAVTGPTGQVQVIPLGNLRGGRPPSPAQTELARFFFGTDPQTPLALVKPTRVFVSGARLWICDTALGAVFSWRQPDETLREPPLSPRPRKPVSVAVDAGGGMLVVDAAAHAVLDYGPSGALRRRYVLDEPFRPADALRVGGEVWVANVAQHRIEVFDGGTGVHVRSIGRRGTGPAEFGMPLALARGPQGEVLVVDMLNARVQVLDGRGRWLRDIGGPGDQVGTFGRPKGVAVGPDGTVFVCDAVSRRIHAFDPQGRPLLAFGDAGQGPLRLALPNGIAVATESPLAAAAARVPFERCYYVLVAEQVADPGIRVFAWRDRRVRPLPRVRSAPARRGAAGASNPHWSSRGCAACHTMRDGRPEPIPARQVDGLCLSCHDGRQAAAEAHPVDRPARGAGLRVPGDWPLMDGRLGCLTCHDVVRHCDTQAVRPAVNASMLRGGTASGRLAFCRNCHVPDESWRINPHRASAEHREACRFCHTSEPDVPADGRRRFRPALNDATSNLCLTCHARHWDYAPGGHIERPVPERIRFRLLASEARLAGEGAGRPVSRPVRFPLADGRVACFTCHNPHPPGLFPAGSELGSVVRAGPDARFRLRLPQPDLCLACHDK